VQASYFSVELENKRKAVVCVSVGVNENMMCTQRANGGEIVYCVGAARGGERPRRARRSHDKNGL